MQAKWIHTLWMDGLALLLASPSASIWVGMSSITTVALRACKDTVKTRTKIWSSEWSWISEQQTQSI